MKRFSEQFNKKAQRIGMRAVERAELRDRLVAYMEYHPLPAELQSVPAPVLTSESFFTVRFNTVFTRSLTGVFALFFIVGVPMLAERSIPGDVLYPVKVQFNEEIRSSLVRVPYEKVAWETERLERRISEARLLAKEGKLTEEAEQAVAAAVKNHSDRAQQEIASLRESDSDEAAIAEIAFASALEVQSEVLEGQLLKDIDNTHEDTSVASLVGVVAAAQKQAANAQSTIPPSYERLLARLETETTNAYELFNSISDQALPAEVIDIKRRLSDIERKVQIAIDAHEQLGAETQIKNNDSVLRSDPTTSTEAVSEAVIAPPLSESETIIIDDLRSALIDTRKLISFMTDIDVRETVTIEELVPLRLTDDERIVLIKNTLEEISQLQQEINKRAPIAETEEKFILGLQKLASTTQKAQQELEASQYLAAQVNADEAVAIARDLLVMTRSIVTVPPTMGDTKATSTELVTEETDAPTTSPEVSNE